MGEATERIGVVNEWLEEVDLVLLRPLVLSRASEPMPMPIGTLDAIHLATALIWRKRVGALPEVVTHDAALGAAAARSALTFAASETTGRCAAQTACTIQLRKSSQTPRHHS